MNSDRAHLDPVRLADLLNRGLINELIEALATARTKVSSRVQQHATALLEQFLLQPNVDLGGARTPSKIHPLAIRKSALLRHVIKDGRWQTQVCCMVWLQSNSELENAARSLATKEGIATTEFERDHLHPVNWERSVLARLSKELVTLVPNVRPDQAALALFILCEDLKLASCSAHSPADRTQRSVIGPAQETTIPERVPEVGPTEPQQTLRPDVVERSLLASDSERTVPSLKASSAAGSYVAVSAEDKFDTQTATAFEPNDSFDSQSNPARKNPMYIEKTLSNRQRTTLRDTLRLLNEQLGIGPLREAARDTGLLGRDAKKLDPVALKRLVADPDQLAKLVADALEDRARQASATRTLQRIAQRAEQDPTLDFRAHGLFAKARKALESQDWAQLNRSFEALRKLHSESPHKVLEITNTLVLFASGDASRILYALEAPDLVPSSGLAKSRKAPETARAAPRVSDPTRHATGAVKERVEKYSGAIVDGLRRARESISAELPIAELENAKAVLKSTLSSFESAWNARTSEDLEAQFGAALAKVSKATEDVAAAARKCESTAVGMVAAVSESLGGPQITHSVALNDLPKLRAALTEQVASAEREAMKVVEGARDLPTDVFVELTAISTANLEVLTAAENLKGLTASLQEAKAQVEARKIAEEQALQRAAQDSKIKVDKNPPTPFRFSATVTLEGVLASGLVGRLAHEAQREIRNGEISFLPQILSERATLIELAPGVRASELANSVATNLFALWAQELRSSTRPLAQYMEFLAEARKIVVQLRRDPGCAQFERITCALALHSAAEDRTKARGQRRLSELLQSATSESLDAGLRSCAQAVSGAAATPRVCAELIDHGFGRVLSECAAKISLNSPADGRRLLDALAVAAALCNREASAEVRRRVLEALSADISDLETIEDYLSDLESQSRRGSRPDVPRLKSTQPLVTDFVSSLSHRWWERGKPGTSSGKVTVSIPKAAQKGIYLSPGTRNVEVPVLIRNGGDSAVAGISVLLGPPAKGDTPLRTRSSEIHVPWLSDQNLEDSAAVVGACTLEMDPERVEAFRELRLAVRTSWFGGKAEETYVIPLRFEPPRLALADARMSGYDGRPVDLNEEITLRLSSTSVQRCFTTIRDELAAGKPLRAYIYGRRRRGKSSICTSLRDNSKVQNNFAVQDRVWNGARMTTVETAFSTLAETLASALAKTGVSAPKLELSDLTRAEEISQRFLTWFDAISDSVKETKRIFLVLDEFQKWLAGLGSPQERLALLAALRHFNDRKSRVEVSFVLSGLQNLKALVQESNDLANALEAFEIRALTNEEADRYLRERLPIELDGRTRRRLISLSGGNPYVLNRLGGNLIESLREKGRQWCTASDVEALLSDDDAQTGRLNEFVKYMLHEDEDDGAATLRQLTVLRASASLLRERGDFDGYVRNTDVEAWLGRNGIDFEKPVVERHLEELAQLDLLQLKPGGRYYLRGEWLSRALAALDPATVKLQPVTARGDPELVLGRFRRKDLLGRGGEAEIWLAENVLEGGRDVVLRIYPLNTVGLARRVEREKEILEKIHHPNVVAFHGASIDERHGGVVVLDHIAGYTLDELLKSPVDGAQSILPGGELSKQVQLLKKLAGAVHACHVAGVVHKDLSPRNVMLAPHMGVWEPKIIDFGIAGFDTQPVDVSGTTVLGTPGYVAPEKVKVATARRTPKADVFSLGALFVKVLTGKDPGELRDFGPALQAEFASSKIPSRLFDLVQRMLSSVPETRPDADEVENGLETVLEPLTWRELHAHALDAYMEDRSADAVRLYGQALAAVPAADRGGEKYELLLDEALDVLQMSVETKVPWDTQWLSHWLTLARRTESPRPDSRRVLTVLLKYRMYSREAGKNLLKELVSRLAEPPTSPYLASLVASLAREELLREALLVDSMFDALASYCVEGHVPASLVEDFCVACAKAARVKYQQLIAAELWLQRARRLGGPPRADYESEVRILEDARRKTGKLQTLPKPPSEQQPFRLGDGERGHMVVERIERFDENVRKRFPFIYRMERVRKDRALPVSRPTLLRLDNIASHVPQGSGDPGNIIPLALDASFTGDVALRVNIVLPEGTTISQREAAYNVLRAESDLFDCIE